MNLIEVHVAERTPEMEVIFDMNAPAQNAPTRASSRTGRPSCKTMLSPELAELVRSGKIKLVTYQQLIARNGLTSMQQPR